MSKYDVHPYCAAFPDMGGEDFEALRDDLKMRGQQEPCWTFEKWIIDGKNRERALLANKQPINYAKWEPLSKDPALIDREIREFTISKNLHRRHLDASQRAMIAATMATGKRGGDRSKGSDDPLTREQAAAAFDVGEKLVDRAANVLTNGAPEVVKAVESGTVTVSDAARIVNRPKPEQRAAVEKVESGKAPTLAKAAGVKPAQAAVVRDGKRTIKSHASDAIEKKFGAMARDIDDLARDAGLNNCQEHRRATAKLSNALQEFLALAKLCNASTARKAK